MKSALLLIDIQKGFDDPNWGQRNNPGLEANITALLNHWRGRGDPVIHVKHNSTSEESPLWPGHLGNEIYYFAKPLDNEPLFEKNVNSAFIGTGLSDHLTSIGNPPLVLVGLTSDHCVNTTARMAGNLGHETYMVADATATFNKIDHQ